MSSGSLPLATYHRTQALGAGSFGSVVTVYNDDGAEFAMKLFVGDDDDDNDDNNDNDNRDTTVDVGALVEISVLRLLRDDNGHANIVALADVTGEHDDDDEEEGAGAGTAGCWGMTMPLYPLGSLEDALLDDAPLSSSPLWLQSRPNKIRIAHGLLSAVTFLHDNGIMHRDIKSDNVMLRTTPARDGTRRLHPVLIDFSLAKLVNGAMYGRADDRFPSLDDPDRPTTHTGQAGTATYMAPEVHACEPYDHRSDLWSLGVVLLEVLQKAPLRAVKATQAEPLIAKGLDALSQPHKPFPTLVRHLLQKDPDQRWTAREGLEHLATTLLSDGNNNNNSHGILGDGVPVVPPVKIISLKDALPFDDDNHNREDDDNEENVVPSKPTTKTPRKYKKKVDPVLARRRTLVHKIGHYLNCDHPLTLQAALCYGQRMVELDEELDDLEASQTLLDCVVLAHKVFEVDMLDLTSLETEYPRYFGNDHWNLDDYRDNEATILMMMDHCLFPRELALMD